jgi:DNA-binding MarR family transcriptional regulator
MNAIAFGTKRAFHGFLRVTRKPFAWLGLTAARFDMMSALYGRDGPLTACRIGLRQSDLRRVLGVSASVVSRMVRALEKLGLVTRQRERDGDRRQIRVDLTQAGEECIRRARRIMLRGVLRIVYVAICFGSHRDPTTRFESMDNLESFLRGLRCEFGDTASLYYPWGHPDD